MPNICLTCGESPHKSLDTFQPLARDLTNLPNGFQRRERAGSLDIVRSQSACYTVMARAKLRRSRSVSDIRDIREIRPMKRPKTTLAPIPCYAYTGASTNATTQIHFVFNANVTVTRPPRIGNVTASTTVSSKRQLPTRPQIGAGAPAQQKSSDRKWQPTQNIPHCSTIVSMKE
ncbi:uncharacterized protein [Eurosta solidaginis]